jgi:alpha-tubulin suppressor-like RCC1 family protein
MKSWSLSVILSVFIFSQTFASSFCAKLIDARCGETHTLALSEDGRLFSCGQNIGGRLGQGVCNDYVYFLKQVKGLDGSGFLKNVIAFDAGWKHSLVVVGPDGSCLSFGTDPEGQLGNGDYEYSSNVPTKVHGLNNDANGLKHITMVSAGRSGKHSLAVDSNGYVYAWGLNEDGQCGDGNPDYNPIIQYPTIVLSTGTDPNFTYLGEEAFIVDIEAGVRHSLALEDIFDGGHVYQWGYGVARPLKVPDQNNTGYLSNIVDIATCEQSLAVDLNGYVWYWNNYYRNPVRIAGGDMGTTYLQNIVKVGAGDMDRCYALDENENIWQWTGRNGTPVKVTDGNMVTQTGYLENITAFDAGYNDFCVAVDEYGRGWAWGQDADAYAGIGQYADGSEPIEMLCAELTSPLIVTKTDDINDCIMPYDGIFDQIIDYTIHVDANNFTDANVVLIDVLPAEVDYISSNAGIYDPGTRIVIWDIGSMPSDYNEYFQLQVKLNANSATNTKIINTAELIGDSYYTQQIKESPLCCIQKNIFVKWDAAGANNGTSWDDAYTNLQTAIEKVGCAEKILVAAGTYYPTDDPLDNTATFQLPNWCRCLRPF